MFGSWRVEYQVGDGFPYSRRARIYVKASSRSEARGFAEAKGVTRIIGVYSPAQNAAQAMRRNYELQS